MTGATLWSWSKKGLCLALATLLLIALLSHSLEDAAWSTSGQAGLAVRNALGTPGAYVSDALLYLFGYSTHGLVILGMLAVLWPRWRVQRSNVLAAAALLVSACVLEWLAGSTWDAYLPSGAGGALGSQTGTLLLRNLPFLQNAQTTLLITLMFVCLSLLQWVGRFRWPQLCLWLGTAVMNLWASWSKHHETQQDITFGEQAAQRRASEAAQQPVAAADALAEEAVSATLGETRGETVLVQTPPQAKPSISKRLLRERQVALFENGPDNDLPRLDLLDKPPAHQESVSTNTLEMTSRLIEKKLSDFGVVVRVMTATPGPVITRYEIEPATGIKGAQIVNLAKDLARSLSLVSIRVVETIPGKNLMALELPNARRQAIKFSEIVSSDAFNDAKSTLTLGLGKDIVGAPVVVDLARMPHCLVAGTTGSGKSVGINAMILSLLYKASPKEVRLLLIDPKMLEMSVYEGIAHLIAPVVTDMRQAAHGLNWCVAEMERRYKLMSKLGVRNLAGFNAKLAEASRQGQTLTNPFSLNPDAPEPLEPLPHIVVVIDELADLMMVVGKKIEELIARLAQKARAAGIHLILATQRPSVDVITGLIKANIPTRIAFQVSSKIDSRTILDQMGAEALLGMGDMLFMPSGTGLPIRVHGAFVSDEEVHRVVAYLKTRGEADYIEGVLDGQGVEGDLTLDLEPKGSGASGEKDPLYDQAVEIVLKNRKASISLVQRHLKVGYNRAARMLEDMQTAGLVSALTSNGSRELLPPDRTP